jgi:hypothetical protein
MAEILNLQSSHIVNQKTVADDLETQLREKMT